MDEYSVIDKRKYPFLLVDKAIPLAYAPYIGAESVCIYILYASMADQGNFSFFLEDVRDFLGIDDNTLEKCNKSLEEYGLIKLESHERNGKIVNSCYVLQPPPFPRTLYSDLQNKALVRDIIQEMLNLAPAEQKTQPKRTRTSLITPTKLISKFYSMMGNGNIDIFERESGKKVITDLTNNGYSLEDIDFAIEWSFDNARDSLEDLSSIKELIAQAIEAREKYIAERSKQAEKEAKSNQNEDIERKTIEAYKKFMSDSEKKALRERAMNIIKQDNRINEEFITEQFIIIKENEIIREEYLKKGVLRGKIE
jgi:DNA-binding transcriptional MerR regulator